MHLLVLEINIIQEQAGEKLLEWKHKIQWHSNLECLVVLGTHQTVLAEVPQDQEEVPQVQEEVLSNAIRTRKVLLPARLNLSQIKVV